MRYYVPEKLNHDLGAAAIVDSLALVWTPSPLPGIERRFLERNGGEVARATSIVRYAPGGKFSSHVHEKGEEYLVLSGVFSDESGDFTQGTYVRNRPGSRHAPFTRDGCVIFVKLRQMPLSERDTRVVCTNDVEALPTEINGLSRIFLHSGEGGELVSIDVLAPGTEWRDRGGSRGEEILSFRAVLPIAVVSAARELGYVCRRVGSIRSAQPPDVVSGRSGGIWPTEVIG